MITKGASLAFVGLVGGLTAVAVAQPIDNFVNTPTNVVWEDWHDRAHVEFAQTKEAPDPGMTNVVWRAALHFWSGVSWNVTEQKWETSVRIHAFAKWVSAASPDLDSAVWLAALAQSETDFKPWATDGSCNLFAWRQKNGDKQCDSGNAYGYWQMHLDEQHRPGDPTGDQCLAWPTECARAALRWLRETPTAWASATTQHARAQEYLRKYPPSKWERESMGMP